MAQIPEHIKLLWHEGWSYAGNATDPQACLDAAYALNTTLEAISFDAEAGSCYYHFQLRETMRRSSDDYWNLDYWIRIDRRMHLSAVTSCLTDQDARYLLVQMAYEGESCRDPGTLYENLSPDPVTGLCVAESQYGPSTSYDYDGGVLQNGTQYFLSRDQAVDAISYMCDNVRAPKMIFNGTWYCYYAYNLSSSEQARGESIISDDYCSQLFDSTAHVVKISEPREYEFIYGHFENVHLGLTLRSGMTYQWYDGTVTSDLPWLSGHPVGGSNTLVRTASADGVAGFNVVDTAPPITSIVCKKPATPGAYDACAKFKTCT